MKPRARVTATYELNAKAAPQLEALLRELVPAHISCVVLEIETHGEQVSGEPDREREAHGRREQRVKAGESVDKHARKDGLLARVARKVAGKK